MATVRDIASPENLRSMSFDDMMGLYNYLNSQGEDGQKAASYIQQNWATIHQYDEGKDAQQIADRNNNPMYQLAMGGGGAVLGGAGMAGGTAAANAIFSGGAAATVPAVPAVVGSGVVGGGSAGAAGAAGAGATGTAGMGALGLGGLVAAGVAGSIAGNELAEKYGGGENGAGSVAYNAAMAQNPINQVWQGAEDLGNIMSGKDISLSTQVATAWPTGGLSLLYNPVFGQGGMFGSSKGKDQLARDAIRNDPRIREALDQDYNFTFSDGGKFNFGMDGGAELENQNPTNGMSGFRHYYDVDWSDPNAGEMVGSLAPLSSAMGLDDKAASDFTGYLYNSVNSGGDPSKRRSDLYNAIYGSGDAGRNKAAETVWASFNAGNITAEQRNSQLADVDEQYGWINPNQGKGGVLEYGDAYIKPGEEKDRKRG